MLGAGGGKRTWKFDFMGASKYFFSMSGVILLIGALAIGGKGLNLGIDFTSGTRITVGLEKAATQQQVSSLLTSQGVSDPQVQKVSGSKSLGPNAYQISFKKLPSGGRQQLQTAFQNRYGIENSGKAFDYTSVGPTFGRTVANSAVIAIIASLLVIAAYVALRFSWKFSIPVMIALAHDLLITSGVYALTGRQVTTATVAALLTILGYSMYDTIIVFDRVRENIPRMPRAAFSQIVNRSMSEVLTRSIATTSCTLMPIIALLVFGGSAGSTELTDFAFALLVGVASGAYSSIFIASPVLTHWKERESQYRHRRERIETGVRLRAGVRDHRRRRRTDAQAGPTHGSSDRAFARGGVGSRVRGDEARARARRAARPDPRHLDTDQAALPYRAGGLAGACHAETAQPAVSGAAITDAALPRTPHEAG